MAPPAVWARSACRRTSGEGSNTENAGVESLSDNHPPNAEPGKPYFANQTQGPANPSRIPRREFWRAYEVAGLDTRLGSIGRSIVHVRPSVCAGSRTRNCDLSTLTPRYADAESVVT